MILFFGRHSGLSGHAVSSSGAPRDEKCWAAGVHAFVPNKSHPPRSSPPPAPSTASAPTTGTPRARPPPGTETRQMPRHREAHLTSNALTTPRAIPRRQEINRVCEALSLSAHQPLDSTGEPLSRPDRSHLLCSRQLSVKSSEEGTRLWTPRFPLSLHAVTC